jgi:hypothetical protein
MAALDHTRAHARPTARHNLHDTILVAAYRARATEALEKAGQAWGRHHTPYASPPWSAACGGSGGVL